MVKTQTILKMVKLNDNTHAKLAEIGKYGETMDDIINKCIEAYQEREQSRSKAPKK